MKPLKTKQTKIEIVYDIVVKVLLIIFTIFLVYPFYNSVVLSFNEGLDANAGGIYFWPRKFTFDNYIAILNNGQFLFAFFISISRTIIGTITAVIFTAMYGFAISKKELVFKKFYVSFGLITMYFGGGLIPFYILIRDLKLYNNFLVYIIPLLFSMFNAIIFMSYFRSIPASLDESAKIDGANYLTIFFKIILPVSTPVFAAISIFIAVGQWNSWFDTMLYTKSENLRTLTFFFTQIVMKEQFYQNMASKVAGTAGSMLSQRKFTGTALQLSSMVLASAPIIVVYPFLQKYFVQGIMIGSVKG